MLKPKIPKFENFLHRWILLIGLFLICSNESALGQPKLEAGFENPPISARPKGYWDWVNGNFSLSRLTEEMEDAKDKGMGGFDIWDVGTFVDADSVVPAGPEFMGEQSVQAIGYVVREAERVGMEIGLTISSSWNAGGSWVSAKHGAMGLFRSSHEVIGPSHFSGNLGFPELPKTYGDRHVNILEYTEDGIPVYYKDVGALAYKHESDSILSRSNIIDLTDSMDQSGSLKWDVPDGKWLIIRYIGIPTGQPLAIPSPNSKGRMLDHFDAEAMELNLGYILDKLVGELGSLENRSLKYLYTDSYEVNTAIWTSLLPEEFEERNGYSLTPYLPVLDGFVVENQDISGRFLFDFKKTLSDLIIENHYKKGREITEKYGLGFHAEAGGPGPPVHNVPFEDLKTLGALTAPRGEFWYNHPRGEKHTNELQIVKGISSASHIYDQTFVEAEAFTSVWVWQEGPAELKPIADRAFCEGLNRIVYHTFPHIPPEAGDPGWVYNFGTLMYTKRAWWPKSKPFHTYLARNSYMLQQGNFVGDVAYYYGDRAPNFVTFKKIPSDLGFGYDYDVINSDAILNHLRVVEGKFVLPHGQSYEVIVLPSEESMNPHVLAKLKDLVKKGGIIVGPKPSRSYGLKDYQLMDQNVRLMADELWGDCDSVSVQESSFGSGKVVWGKPLRKVLEEKGLGPDFTFERGDDSTRFDFIHRRTDSAEIYYIWNRGNRSENVEAYFRVSGKHPEVWDPVSGKIFKHPIYYAGGQGTIIPLQFDPNGSVFIVFQKPDDGAGIVRVSSTKGKIFPGGTGTWSWTLDPTGRCTFLSPVDETFEWEHADNRVSTIQVSNIPEEQPVDGPWELKFPHGWRAPASIEFSELISWTDSDQEGIKYFSGIVAYHNQFQLSDYQLEKGNRLFLNLGKVREVADVFLNGKPLGIQWHEPYRYDITQAAREGTNYLVVGVANVLSNRLTGDARLPEQYRRTKSNIKKVPSPWSIPMADAPLKESGLLGPVRIEFAKEVGTIR